MWSREGEGVVRTLPRRRLCAPINENRRLDHSFNLSIEEGYEAPVTYITLTQHLHHSLISHYEPHKHFSPRLSIFLLLFAQRGSSTSDGALSYALRQPGLESSTLSADFFR